MSANHYVYALYRPNGQICYIGKGSGLRWRHSARYTTQNKHLSRIIKNAGGELKGSILKNSLTEHQAFKLEIKLIAKIGRAPKGPLVNLTDGGEGCTGNVHWNGQTHPHAALAIGKAHKGRVFSLKVRKKMSISAKKRIRGIDGKYSPEHASAISEGMKKFWEKRRKQYKGKPPSLRSQAGHKKHSKKMKARYARLRHLPT